MNHTNLPVQADCQEKKFSLRNNSVKFVCIALRFVFKHSYITKTSLLLEWFFIQNVKHRSSVNIQFQVT